MHSVIHPAVTVTSATSAAVISVTSAQIRISPSAVLSLTLREGSIYYIMEMWVGIGVGGTSGGSNRTTSRVSIEQDTKQSPLLHITPSHRYTVTILKLTKNGFPTISQRAIAAIFHP